MHANTLLYLPLRLLLQKCDMESVLHAPPKDKKEQQSFLSEIKKIALISKGAFCGVVSSNDQGISGTGGNKLKTYKIMKQYFPMEPYLECQLPRIFAKSIVASQAIDPQT